MTEKGELTRSKIAEAALKVLRSFGLGGLSMRKVSLEAGVSLGHLQYHYPSREALLAGVAEHHLGVCRASMQEGIRAQADSNPFTALTVALTQPKVVAVAGVFRDLFALAELDEKIRETLLNYFAESFSVTVEMLAHAYPSVEASRIESVATLLLTAVEGYYLIGAATPFEPIAMAGLLERTAKSMLNEAG